MAELLPAKVLVWDCDPCDNTTRYHIWGTLVVDLSIFGLTPFVRESRMQLLSHMNCVQLLEQYITIDYRQWGKTMKPCVFHQLLVATQLK